MNVDPIQNACARAAKPCVNVSGHNTELNTVPLNITIVEDIESVGNIRRMSAGIYQEGRVMWLDTKVNLKAHIYALVILSGNSQLNVEKDFFSVFLRVILGCSPKVCLRYNHSRSNVYKWFKDIIHFLSCGFAVLEHVASKMKLNDDKELKNYNKLSF